MKTPQQFLTQVWGDPPPGVVNIWTLPERTSFWYTNFGQVDRDMQHHLHEEVYTGTSLAAKRGNRFNSKNRIKVAQAAAIAGLWSDIDVYHPVAHAEKALPATLEQAREVMEQLPHEPTMIVDSGHGLQYWWLFKEPWVFGDADEHEQARRVTQWWHLRTKELFEARSWTVDSVFDLARIMRLPGTFNNKVPGERKQVEVILQDGPRYDREDFLKLVPGDFSASTPPTEDRGSRGGRTGERGGVNAGGLALSPDAQPKRVRLEALLKADPKFRRTWEKNRPDLKDQSASSYNMSIADITIWSGWPEQEAVNAMIYWRRKHGHDLKLRENYYALTVAKAKGPFQTSYDGPEDDGGSGHADEPNVENGPAPDSDPQDLADLLRVVMEGISGCTDPEVFRLIEEIHLLAGTGSGKDTVGDRAAARIRGRYNAFAASRNMETTEALAAAVAEAMSPKVQVPLLVQRVATALAKNEKSGEPLAELMAMLRRDLAANNLPSLPTWPKPRKCRIRALCSRPREGPAPSWTWVRSWFSPEWAGPGNPP